MVFSLRGWPEMGGCVRVMVQSNVEQRRVEVHATTNESDEIVPWWLFDERTLEMIDMKNDLVLSHRIQRDNLKIPTTFPNVSISYGCNWCQAWMSWSLAECPRCAHKRMGLWIHKNTDRRHHVG